MGKKAGWAEIMKSDEMTTEIPKTSIDEMMEVLKAIAKIDEHFKTIKWSEKEYHDDELGRHMDALRHLLDSAQGRTSTIIHTLRRLTK